MNIRDIAKLACVSTATVSRAINNPEAVQESTRVRINQILEETGYTLPPRKRNAEGGVLLFLFNDSDYLFYDRISAGFLMALRDTKYSIMMCPLPDDGTIRKKMIQSLGKQKIAGVIYALRDYYASDIEVFSGKGVPVVLARKYNGLGLEFPRCYVDFSVGSFRMTDYLLSTGCRKIYLMVEKASFQFVESFCSGWKRAFFERDIPFDEQWIIHTQNSVQGGFNKGLELLSSSTIPDAFFCSSNEMALGILRAARDLSIPVPEKLSVVGFTDSPTADYPEPELTTLHHPIEQLGTAIASMLLNYIRNSSEPSNSYPEIVLQPKLCIRQSSRS